MTENLLRLAFTLGLGFGGCWLFVRRKVVSGAMLGALAFVGVANMAGLPVFFRADWKVWIQLLSGAMMGLKVDSIDPRQLRTLWKPLAISLGGIALYTVVMALVTARLTVLDIRTAVFCAAPGGATDLTIMSPDFGADPVPVSLIHILRLMEIYLLVPMMFYASQKKGGKKPAPAPAKSAGCRLFKNQSLCLAALILFAGCCGYGLYSLKVTGGAILGALMGSALFTHWFGLCKFPKWLRRAIPALAGIYIGMQFTPAAMALLPHYLLPAAVMLAGVFVLMMALPRLLMKCTGLPYPACLLACSPGGLQEMILMADDLEGEYLPLITLLQVMRMFFTILFAPLLAGWLGGLGF